MGKSWPTKYVTTKFGGMKIHFFNNYYEFHFNKKGVQYYRCLNHGADCTGRIIVKNNMVYVVDFSHNHESNIEGNYGKNDVIDEAEVEEEVLEEVEIDEINDSNQILPDTRLPQMIEIKKLSLKEQMKLKLQRTLLGNKI